MSTHLRRKYLIKEFLKTFGLFSKKLDLQSASNMSRQPITDPIDQYKQGGKIPWTVGYAEYRHQFIAQILASSNLIKTFRDNGPLPGGYGARLDERVIEYPWIFARLEDRPGLLLDAGSTLNFPFLLRSPLLQRKTLIIYTLAPEITFPSPKVSYLYGDLRSSLLKDAIFDTIVCISTLEHIGMDNAVYTDDAQFHVSPTESDLSVLAEFKRMLKAGGELFITVPYGRRQSFGWFEQFDKEKLDRVIRMFDGTVSDLAFYQYTVGGWQISDAAACAEMEFSPVAWLNVVSPDGAAAARAVACLRLLRQA